MNVMKVWKNEKVEAKRFGLYQSNKQTLRSSLR